MKSTLIAILFVSFFALKAEAAATLAKQVKGFDNIQKTEATDCSFVSKEDGDNLIVGINSSSAGYVNTLVRIAKADLPLSEGYSGTDWRGFKISFADGIFTASRVRGGGEGLGSEELTEMKITVNSNLTHPSTADVSKRSGVFKHRTDAFISCQF